MEHKLHASEVVKLISKSNKIYTYDELSRKFDNGSFQNCSGECMTFDQLIDFMTKKGAVVVENGNVIFKGCPSSGC